jgi:hypothetical protein
MSSMDVKIRILIQSYKFLYTVDQLAQLANFENLLESSQTTLPKVKLFLMTCSTSVQIYKNYSGLDVFASMVHTKLYNPVSMKTF